MGLWDRLHKDDQISVGGPSTAETMTTGDERPKEIWGRPSRCPKCNSNGYLDRVDIVDRIQYEHCTTCFHKWSVAEADTEHADA